MNKAKLYMFICVSILAFSISSTLALYIWRSTTSAIVKLEVCAPTITFVGGPTINGEDLVPALSKENGLKKEIKVKLNKLCQDDDSAVMNLYMSLDLLPKELQEETFIYELYQEDKLIISDNFKGKSEGETVTLLENGTVTDKELKYTLYIYVDGKKDNPIAMSNKPFRFNLYGEGTDAIYEENYIRATEIVENEESIFLNTDIKRKDIESITTVDNNIVPDGIYKSFDISSKGDRSVILWYEDSNSNNLYEIYMGSNSGLIKLNTSSSYLFAYLTNATEMDLSKLDTSKVSAMSYMFNGCSSLISLNLSNFNTENVTYTACMFYSCKSLISLNLSSFNTSEVINMNSMFYNCSNLVELNLNNFDTSKVHSIGYMFSGCSSLTNLDLSSFNTKSITYMSGMFYGCNSLTNLDLSNFDTSSVISMNNMFYNCSSLTNIDLSNFDTSKVTNMSAMFYNCKNLMELDFRNADFYNVTDYDSMFVGSYNNITVYVKDTTQSDWLLERFPKLENIVVV